MFVEAHRPLPTPWADARVALDRALADGGLIQESRRAYDDGVSFLMRVGPRGSAGLSKQVLVRLLPARDVAQTVVVPLRWEATGPAGRLFPTLDANLGLTAAGDSSSLLSIIGRYEPPLGPLGSSLDHALMTRAARRTAETLLAEIARKLGRLRE
jgi:hypothetical protein